MHGQLALKWAVAALLALIPALVSGRAAAPPPYDWQVAVAKLKGFVDSDDMLSWGGTRQAYGAVNILTEVHANVTVKRCPPPAPVRGSCNAARRRRARQLAALLQPLAAGTYHEPSFGSPVTLKLGVYYKGALVAPGQSPTTAAGWLEYLNFFLTGNPYYDKAVFTQGMPNMPGSGIVGFIRLFFKPLVMQVQYDTTWAKNDTVTYLGGDVIAELLRIRSINIMMSLGRIEHTYLPCEAPACCSSCQQQQS